MAPPPNMSRSNRGGGISIARLSVLLLLVIAAMLGLMSVARLNHTLSLSTASLSYEELIHHTTSSLLLPAPLQAFPPWQPGFLDVHHIRVGCSVSTFAIFPDGTTLLIDAGDLDRYAIYRRKKRYDVLVQGRFPDNSKDAAGWIVEYVKQMWPRRPWQPGDRLDYVLVTHFHPDHIGSLYDLDGTKLNPPSRLYPDAPYRLSGIPAVAEEIPIRKLLDRGYPNYDYPIQNLSQWDANFHNYQLFVKYHVEHDLMSAEAFQVGSRTQIKPQSTPQEGRKNQRGRRALMEEGEVDDGKGNAVHFIVRNIRANLDVSPATQENSTVYQLNQNGLLSDKNDNGPPRWDENQLSTAIVIEYGDFRYYEGGDQEYHGAKGNLEALDTASPTAKAAGRVDVATGDHHMQGTTYESVAHLDPTIVVLQAWEKSQPPPSVVEMLKEVPRQSPSMNNQDNNNITQTAAWVSHQTKRRGFATSLCRECLASHGPGLLDFFDSTAGHVVVRVYPPRSPVDRNDDTDQQTSPMQDKQDHLPFPKQSYEVFVLNENKLVQSRHGPFDATAK